MLTLPTVVHKMTDPITQPPAPEEQKKIQKLSKLLLENNIQHNNKFEILVYNSPYKIINRRNEITVNITYP